MQFGQRQRPRMPEWAKVTRRAMDSPDYADGSGERNAAAKYEGRRPREDKESDCGESKDLNDDAEIRVTQSVNVIPPFRVFRMRSDTQRHHSEDRPGNDCEDCV